MLVEGDYKKINSITFAIENSDTQLLT